MCVCVCSDDTDAEDVNYLECEDTSGYLTFHKDVNIHAHIHMHTQRSGLPAGIKAGCVSGQVHWNRPGCI